MPRKKADGPAEGPVPTKKRPPRISVLERRLQNPFGDGSPPIKLKDPGWVVHVINGNLRQGRYHDVVRNKGWVPVEPGEIDGAPEDFGFDVKEGRVVRGPRGEEVLMKMPAEDYREIQMAKDAHNRRLTHPTQVKADISQAAAKELGDRAGDYLDRAITTVNVERSPIPLDEGEDQPPAAGG